MLQPQAAFFSNAFSLQRGVGRVHAEPLKHQDKLITTLPGRTDWYHAEGCAHLSVEAYWQMSKVIEVRYDRFLALDAVERDDPMAGL